jgi:hypothetical protein
MILPDSMTNNIPDDRYENDTEEPCSAAPIDRPYDNEIERYENPIDVRNRIIPKETQFGAAANGHQVLYDARRNWQHSEQAASNPKGSFSSTM